MPQSFDTPFPGPWRPDALSEIQRRTPAAAGDSELTHLPDALVTTPLPVHRPAVLPFHPVKLQTTNGTTNAYLQPAWVAVRHLRNRDDPDGGLNLVAPLISNISMWSAPWPPLTLVANTSYNYLNVTTDPLGKPTSDFTIESHNAVQSSTHHYPPDPDGTDSQNGNYLLELFRTDLASNIAADRVTLGWGGHLYWDQALSDHRNRGNGFRVADEFDQTEGIHYFNTHTANHGHNIVLESNELDHFFHGTNNIDGGPSGNVAYVYSENIAKEKAEFNVLVERQAGGSSQVKVIQSGLEDYITIQGNGYDNFLSLHDCGGNVVSLLNWKDGLLVSITCTNVTLGDCSAPS